MIHIQYLRVGPIVVAMTVDDRLMIKSAFGLTHDHAAKRLIRKEDR